MKIAIACDESAEGLQVSKVFARCEKFTLYDAAIDEMEYVDNPFMKIKDHAGEEAARFLAERGVKRIIGYEFGYKSRKIAEQHLIQLIVLGKDHMMVSELMRMIRETYLNTENNK